LLVGSLPFTFSRWYAPAIMTVLSASVKRKTTAVPIADQTTGL